MDLDSSGRTDIISGSWPGEIYWFQRRQDGTFSTGEPLKHGDGQRINVGSASAAFAVDWTGNGLLDLIVGTIQGEVWLVQNEGEPGRNLFGESRQLYASGEPIKVDGGCAGPLAADWDGDGRLDLLVGTGAGSVLWFRNVGRDGEPELDGPRVLVPESPLASGSQNASAWGRRVKPAVVDWNENGRLDLLLGDLGLAFQQQPSQTPTEQAQKEAATNKLPELREKWADTFQQYSALLSEPPGDDEPAAAGRHEEQLAELRQRLQRYRDEITAMQEILAYYQPQRQMHGFVWLFERKP